GTGSIEPAMGRYQGQQAGVAARRRERVDDSPLVPDDPNMATAGGPDPEGEDAGLAARALDHDPVGHGRGQGEAGTAAQRPPEGDGELASRSGPPDRHLTEITRGAVDHEVPLVGREKHELARSVVADLAVGQIE